MLELLRQADPRLLGVFNVDQRVGRSAELPFPSVDQRQVGETGRVLVTTWSGRVFAVDPKSFAVETIAFPRLHAGGLYYAAATYRGTPCARYCAGVGVVCTADE